MKVEIYDSLDSLGPLGAEWDSFLIRVGGPVYLSLSWCKAWWECFGRGKSLAVVAVREEERLVGLVPLVVERVPLLLFRVRVARLLGAFNPPRVFSIPAEEGFLIPVLRGVVEAALVRLKCDMVSLGPVPAASTRDALHRTCAGLNGSVSGFQEREMGVFTLFPLKPSFEEQLRTLSKRQRYFYRNGLKKLAEEMNAHWEPVPPDHLNEEFERFVEMHTRQWNAQGRPGFFRAWEGMEELNRALLKDREAKDRLRFSRVSADGETIGYQYSFRFGTGFFAQITARVLDDSVSEARLGTVGFVKMMEWAVEDGAKWLEAGIGRYEYKRRLGGEEIPLSVFRIPAGRFERRLKARLLTLRSDILNTAYYKVWYQRIRPRIPGAFRKPIARFHLDSRV